MNEYYNSKERFKEFTKNSFFLRVDDKHPLNLYIGLNDDGYKTIRFSGVFDRVKIKGTKSIEITHTTYHEQIRLGLTLIDNEYEDLFYLLCNDLIDSSRVISQEMGYTFLVNRFERWRLFSGLTRKYLSEPEIKGLTGELIFLKDVLFAKFGISKSIQGWTGPEPLKKDFSYDDKWYEIKAISGDKITISSIEQLDGNNMGLLVVYNLEKMSSEFNGISLNKIVNEIMDVILLDQDRNIFIMKLMQANFYNEEYYDQFVYEVTNRVYYKVNEMFPKLTRENLPQSIGNVKYDLIVNMLDRFITEEL